MDCEDWDLYLDILKEISEGEKHKQKLEEDKAKRKKK